MSDFIEYPQRAHVVPKNFICRCSHKRTEHNISSLGEGGGKGKSAIIQCKRCMCPDFEYSNINDIVEADIIKAKEKAIGIAAVSRINRD